MKKLTGKTFAEIIRKIAKRKIILGFIPKFFVRNAKM